MQDVDLKGSAEIFSGRGRNGLALGVKTGVVLAVATGATFAGGPSASAKSLVSPPLSDLQIVGHRGGSDWGTAGSLPTLKHAMEEGAEAVEFDVRFTKDGRTVVMHDPSVDGVTNCHGLVEDMTYKKFRSCKMDDGSTPPNIYEALKLVAKEHKKVYVHVKVADTKAQAKKVMRAINKYHLNDGHTATTIASNTHILRELKLAGTKKRGYVFNTPAGWNANYSVLIPFNTPVTASLVKKAQEKGRFVAAVESHPVSLGDVVGLHLNGILANNLDRALINLGAALGDVNNQLKNLTGKSDNDPDTGTDGA
jgi:glycerophosphoryl diester phosphodiesterase